MKEKIIKALLVASVLLVNNVFCQFTRATFDEVMDRGGRWKKSKEQLLWIIELHPEQGSRLNFMQKWALVNAKDLVNLETLVFTAQDIDDVFIERICINPWFSRVINLDLRGNPEITQKSLDEILYSEKLGRLKWLRQVSGRYGIPSSEIHVQVAGTSITSEEIRQFNSSMHNPLQCFSIFYRNPVTGKPSETSDDLSYGMASKAIKWVIVEQGDPVSMGIFRYVYMDIARQDTIYTKSIAKYLTEIKEGLEGLKRIGTPVAVTISFAKNHLDYECVAEILKLCQGDEFLRNNFTNLDLNNNCLTQRSFDLLIKLLQICPKLVVDIAPNDFNWGDIIGNVELNKYLQQDRIVHL